MMLIDAHRHPSAFQPVLIRKILPTEAQLANSHKGPKINQIQALALLFLQMLIFTFPSIRPIKK